MAYLVESDGTVTSCDRRILFVNSVIKSRIGYTNLEVIKELMNVYSTNIEFNTAKEITEEICKNIKKYDGICDIIKVPYWPAKSSRILFAENSEYQL